MSFLNPLGLLGLLALPVILGLHLLRKRQRPVVVSHLGLWAFLDAQARGPRARRIPLSWLLLLDLLIGGLLGLALARPRLDIHLPVLNARHAVVLLDISTSMLAGEGESRRIDQARRAALDLLAGLGRRDALTVVAFGRSARLVGDSRQVGFDELADRIENLQAGETSDSPGAALNAAFSLGMASMDESLPVEFHVFTDGGFQLEEPDPLAGLPVPVQWGFFGRQEENQAVLALSAASVEQDRFQVFARLANPGSRTVSRTVSFSLNGRLLSSDPVEIPAGSSVTKVWQAEADLRPGVANAVSVSFSGRDALEEDDSAALGLQVGGSGKVRVALVADNPAPLDQAIRALPAAELEIIAPADYDLLAAAASAAAASAAAPATPASLPYDLTIFRSFLPAALPGGQVLVVEPPEPSSTVDTLLLTSASRRDIPAGAPLQVPQADPLLAGMDFGGVRWSRALALDGTPEGFVTLLQAGEIPLFLRGLVEDPENGLTRVYVLLADLSQGNFTRHPAFPILLANLVLDPGRQSLPASVHSGEAIQLPAPGGFQAMQVFAPGRETESFTARGGDWPSSWEDTLTPGLYRFRLESTANEVIEALAGVNAGSQIESDLARREWTGRIGAGAPAGRSGFNPPNQDAGARQVELAPWLLGAAALVLLLEAALAWKPVVRQA